MLLNFKKMNYFFGQTQMRLRTLCSRDGTLFPLLLTSLLCFYGSQAHAVSITANTITRTSGTDCGVATYRITTDTTYEGHNLDLILEITDEHNDLTPGTECISIDSGNILFKIKSNGGAANPEGWMNTTVTVVQQGTTTPVTVDRLVITGFDLDANPPANGGGTDTDDIYFRNPSGSFLSINTEVDYSEGAFFNGDYTAKLKGWVDNNCNDSQASPDPTCRASAIVLNTPSVDFRLQNDNAYSAVNNNNYQRWFFASFRVENLENLVSQDRDYGDAPNTYPSTSQIITAYRALGNGLIPDGEAANQPSADSDGDDTDGAGSAIMFDDEDGVFLNGSSLSDQTLIAGTETTLDISTLSSGYLNGWIDWNGDGDFDDAGEQIITNQYIANTGETDAAGNPTVSSSNAITNTPFSINTPSNALDGETVARFKFTEDLNPGHSGNSPMNGEVEDYRIIIAQTEINGHLYIDTNGNGTQDAGEPDLANVDVIVTDSNGVAQTVTTDATGNYTATVPPGATITDIDENDPDYPAGATQTEGSDPTTTTAVAGTNTFTENDGLYVPAEINGHLYIDTNGNGTQDAGEPDLANIDVIVTDSNGVAQTVTTDATGNYTATVPPGTTITDIDENDPDYPAGATQTEGSDPTTTTAVAGTNTFTENDGLLIPAIIDGHLYIDTNGNGTQDAGEPDLANVDVIVTDSNGVAQTVTTDATGNYTATVPPGATITDIDENDPDYPAGATQTEGSDPTTTTAVAGTNTFTENDGLYVPAEINGHLYIDTNGNGTQDAGEPDLANVDVIVTDSNGVAQTVTTDATGNYTATVPPGATITDIDENDPDYPAGATQTEGSDPTTTTAVAGTNTFTENDGLYVPAEINGHLYIDTNGNGTQDAGEPDLANVDVIVTDSNGVTQTVTTDPTGNYTATVPPGATITDIDENDPDYPAGATQTEGSDPTTTTAVAGTNTFTENDGLYVPAEINGHLYIDTNGNGTQDAGEPDLANVDVIVTDSNGVAQTVTTDATGNYTATVPPGATITDIDENDPDYPAGATQTEGSDPTTTTAVAGTNTFTENDGLYVPAEINGHLYIDTNGNGTQDAGEPDLANVDVIVTDSNGVAQTVTTDATGNYTATVPPGATITDIDENDPDYPAGATQTEGSDPTTTTAVAGTNTFTENDGLLIPAIIDGHLYIDTNGNGTQDAGEPDLANVDVIVTDSNGVAQTVTTDATGNYTATVPPGATITDIDENDPDYPAGATQTEGSDPTTTTAVAGTNTFTENDGLFITIPAIELIKSITSVVDTNGDGVTNAGDTVNYSFIVTNTGNVTLNNVTVEDTIATVVGGPIATMPPGATDNNTFSASYLLTQTDLNAGGVENVATTTGFFSDTPVSDISDSGTTPDGNPVPDPGTTETQSPLGTHPNDPNDPTDDPTTLIFSPGVVAGTVYEDTNGNGVQDPDEPGIAGVDVVVTDVNGVPVTLTTDENGNYATQVPAGSATIDIDEVTLPTGFVQTEGTDPTPVTIPPGGIASDVDGYQPPANAGTVEGVVYEDTDGNGQQDPGEPGISGVTVTITDSAGNTQTLVTDENGGYSATVPPGNTTVDIDETTLPGGSTQTEGDDPTTVNVPANGTASDVDGFEPPADAGTVTGVIYEDTNGNGVQDPGEPGIPGVEVEVTDSTGNTQTVTTDENGNYTATVPPGETTLNVVDETLPGGSTQTQGTDVSTVTVPAGGTATDIDGYAPSPDSGRVEGVVYEDTNGNGTQDAGEPGIEGVHVTVTDSEGNIHTLVTDADGQYGVTVPSGDALVDIEQSDIDGTFTRTEGDDPTTVTVPAGGVGTDVDGFMPGGVVAGTVYEDTNGNGVQDPDEPGIAGVDVVVTDVNGVPVTLTTDENGNYATQVPAGDTTVDVDEATLPTGFTQTQGDDPTTVTVPAGGIASDVDGYQPPANAGTVEGVVYEDTDGNGQQDPGEPGISGVTVTITDSAGNTQTLVTDENGEYSATVPPGNTTVDIDETTLPGGSTQTEGDDPTTVNVPANGTASDVDGFEPPADAGTVTGVIYEDTNGNGVQDPGEPGIPGVEVEVTDSTGNTQTVTTDENGNYTATVPPGETTLNVVDETLPGGSTQTQGTDVSTVTVPAGGTATDIDGYAPSPDSGRVEGVVYEDTNGNGTQDAGEPGIEGVHVTVTDSEGNIHTLVTDADGQYGVTVPSGDALVDIEQSDIDGTFTRTEGDDPTTVTVPAGGVGTDVDGFMPGGVVAGTVYEDTNGNGVQDPDEPGIAGVDVVVTDVNGVPVTLTTDENGNYATQVPAGDTTVDVDEATLPTGFTQTQGDDPTTVTVPAGGIASDVDGYQPPANAGTVEGVVYEDTDGNGQQDPGEPGISGVTVTITDSAGNTQTLVTDENGEYSATVPPGNTTVDIDETTLPGGSTQTEGDDPTTVNVPANGTASDVDGFEPPADAGTVTGVIYEDTNGNGVQDPGEPGIPGVEVEVTDSTGNTQTVTTDENGNYTATVPPGETTLNVVDETLPGGSTQTQGTDVSTVTVPAGGTATDIDGYAPSPDSGRVEGVVYEDTNGNGTQDAGEPGIEGVHVTVTDSEGNIHTLVTDADGQYGVTVPSGDALVDIEQSDIDGTFTRTEGDDPTTVTVPAGGVGTDVDGFMPGGVVAGTVYEDTNGNGVQDPDEPGIAGVDVVVTDVNGVPVTLTTDENGNYATQVPAGDTTVDVDEATLPTGFTQTQGDDPTTVTVPAGGIASDVDGYQPPANAGTVEGVVYEDTDGNGQQDPGEPGISGVTVTITDSAGNTQTLVTDENGEYSATVPPGNTTVDIDETTLPGGSTQTEGDDPTTVNVPANGTASDVDGFEPPADAGTVTGVIYEDTNGNGVQDPGEPGIPGVEVEVTDSTGNTQTVTTDENGNYTATVPPGETTLNVVDETLPGGSTQTQGTDVSTVTVPAGGTATDIDGYAPSPDSGRVEGVVYEDTNGNGTQDAGEPGIEGVHVTVTDSEGNIHTLVTDADGQYGVTVPSGDALVDIEQSDIDGTFTRTEGDDPTTVTVPAGGVGTDVDGFMPGGVVAGTVYEDTNGNGVQDPDEPGIAGVDVVVTDVNGVPVTLTTDENGNYATQVPAGDTTVDVDEATLPTGFTQTQGDDPTTVTVPAGGIASDVDGYQPPANAGTVEGVVYEDTDGNGQQDPGEPGISGVTVTITDSAGNTQTLVTDENGEYSATVPPGNTTVDIDETTLPGGSTQTEGDDPTTVNVPANGTASDVDGFEPPADAGTVTGVIYEDTNGNGVQDPGEPGIPGVEVEVTDSTGNTQTVTTDENGNYTATVPPGETTLNVVDETLPGGSTQTQGTDVSTVTVPAGGTATDIDGYAPSPDSGRVEGVVYEDTNGNGTQDAGEPGIEGVHVTVTDSEGNIHTLVTDADGQYGVTVPSGDALVDIEQSDIDGTFTRTEGDDPTTVTVPAGGVGTDVDGFGPGTAKLELIKSIVSVDDINNNRRTDAGDIVHYSFTVKNVGELSITNITLNDPLASITGGPIAVLHTGVTDVSTFTAVYTLTKADVLAGGVENVAIVTGQGPNGDQVIDTSDAGTTPNQKVIPDPGATETQSPIGTHPNDPSDPTDDPTTLIIDDAFPWNLFMPAIMPHCPRIPDFCYITADGDNEGSNDSPLFKYTFKSNQLELVNRLGAANVETMILSLDGQTIYATNDGIFGIIDPTPGMNDSFIPIDPTARDAGIARGSMGTVAIRDIDGLSFDPVSGILYGSNRHETLSDLLVQLNPETGKIIPNAFGSGIDYVVIDAAAIGAGDIDDIAVDSDGTLYGIAGNSGGAGNDHLVVIDKLTGAVSDRGSLHLEGKLIQDMEGLTLHNHQTLFGTTGTEFGSLGTANSLYKIDRATGETTFISKLDQNLDGYVPNDFEGITCFPICK